MQYEVGEKFIIVVCDGSFRNQKFYNRIQHAVEKVKTPKSWSYIDFKSLKEIQRLVDEDITDKAYVIYSAFNTSGGQRRDVGRFIYFYDEVDAMAFKLKWYE